CVALLACLHLSLAQAEAPFRFADSSVNADPSDWMGLSEDQVFFRMLTHREEGNSWTIKIGKGGQFYSIKTPELGELIAPQRAEHGQWVDEVFQHVIPMPPQKSATNIVVDGDIHQAGYYIWSDLDHKVQVIPRSVYSPLFAYRHDPAGDSVSYITWPQHAHLPRRYSENQALIAQTIKDLGGGVIEIGVEISKWGGARFEQFNLPFSAFRTRTLPVQVLGNRDGSYRVVSKEFRSNENVPKLREAGTGGWIALVSADSPSARGIGIVYGKDPREIDEKAGVVRWGSYAPGRPEVGGTVATVRRNVSLDAGESLYYRYYLVLGTLAEIQAKGNALESRVVLEKVKRKPEDTPLMPICADAGNGLKRTCEAGQGPVFNAYREFVPGSRPLFLLEKAGAGEYLITDNPYEISFDPTDGATKYLDLLGWVLPQDRTADACRYQPLANAVAAAKPRPRVGQNASELRVVSATADKCPPPGANPGGAR
ncbi:MAG TPA: hypothetical protein VF104_00140, partial [Burkholderiales bacterium]